MERRMLSPEAKVVLAKLPTPEVVTLLDDMVARDNNNNNNVSPRKLEDLTMLGREELLKSVETLPTEKIRDILRMHGI